MPTRPVQNTQPNDGDTGNGGGGGWMQPVLNSLNPFSHKTPNFLDDSSKFNSQNYNDFMNTDYSKFKDDQGNYVSSSLIGTAIKPPSNTSTPTSSGPVDTSSLGLGHPALPNMSPTVAPPQGQSTTTQPADDKQFSALAGNSGLYVNPDGGTTHSANEAEQNQYGHWGSAAFDVGGSNFLSPGSGSAGAGPGLGIYDPYNPKFAYVGNHGIK